MKKIFLLLFLLSFSIFPIQAQWSKVPNSYGYTEMLQVVNNELYATAPCYWNGTKNICNIVKFDGNTWTIVASVDTLGGGYANDVILYNNDLYVAGGFSKIGKWNGSNWTFLGSGINGFYIKDMEVYNGNIYAAGSFSSIDGVNTYGIAKWNGLSWSTLSSGLHGGNITPNGYTLIYKNDLYVGGDFTMAGNVPCNSVARWNGTQWDSISGGVNSLNYGGDVLAFVVDSINDFLYMGGRYKGVGRWDGYVWTTLDSGIIGNIYSLAIYHNQLYAVGYIFLAGGDGVARWNGTYWEAVGGGVTPGGNTVFSAKVFNDELYICGSYSDIGGDTSIYGIARWYSPSDTTCNFLQPIIETMHSLSAPNGVTNTFYYSDSVKVQFYNNIQSAATWHWDFGDGDTGNSQSPNHYYSTAGIYNVSVIVNYPWGPNGTCIDTAYKTITVSHGSGIEEYSKENLNFKLYPNPTNGDITIELTLPNSTSAELRVYSSKGSLLDKYPLQKDSNKITITANKLANGISIVGLYLNNKRVFEEKVIKK